MRAFYWLHISRIKLCLADLREHDQSHELQATRARALPIHLSARPVVA
jgi:hypothetical protein